MDTYKNKEVPDPDSDRARLINKQAALWLLHYMDEPAMDWADQFRFLNWLLRSPDHVAAFLSIYNLDGRLGRHKLRAVVTDESSVDKPDAAPAVSPRINLAATVAPLHKKRTERINRSTGQRWKFAAMAAGMTLTLLLAIAAGVLRLDNTVSTEVGQLQHLTLAEGSVAHLGTRTRLTIEFTDGERLVHLHQGEAVFDVVKDPRPFTVTTPLIDVTAVGTKFGVAMDVGVVATVSEGVVKITAHDNPDTAEATLLRAGQQLRVSNGAPTEAEFTLVDATRALQWADGWLTFNAGQTIGEAVREFNRHNVVQIEIEQPAIAARKLNGLYSYWLDSFRVDSSTRFARTIAVTYDLELIEDRTGKVTRLRLLERRTK